MSIIQKEFIRRVLEDEANRMEKNQGLQMKRLLHFHTGNLFNGRQFTVKQGADLDGVLTIKFKIYQRFLDMKRKVRSKNGNIRNRQYSIHNKYVFGHFYSIGDRLMYELTEDLIEGIKRDLKISN